MAGTTGLEPESLKLGAESLYPLCDPAGFRIWGAGERSGFAFGALFRWVDEE
jgi:hypothetical protein